LSLPKIRSGCIAGARWRGRVPQSPRRGIEPVDGMARLCSAISELSVRNVRFNDAADVRLAEHDDMVEAELARCRHRWHPQFRAEENTQPDPRPCAALHHVAGGRQGSPYDGHRIGGDAAFVGQGPACAEIACACRSTVASVSIGAIRWSPRAASGWMVARCQKKRPLQGEPTAASVCSTRKIQASRLMDGGKSGVCVDFDARITIKGDLTLVPAKNVVRSGGMAWIW
jgi:hypothetical protein